MTGEICSCPNCLHPTAHHAFEDVPGGQRFICVDCPGNTCIMNTPGLVDQRFPTDRPGWLGEWQSWPCGRCGREVSDAVQHDCQVTPAEDNSSIIGDGPMGERIWGCKVGGQVGDLPHAADIPMRQAVAEAYERITGAAPEFVFSGWDTELTEPERAVVEDREPESPDHRWRAGAVE